MLKMPNFNPGAEPNESSCLWREANFCLFFIFNGHAITSGGGGFRGIGLAIKGINFIIVIKPEWGSMGGVVGGKALIAKKQERSSFIEAKIIGYL